MKQEEGQLCRSNEKTVSSVNRAMLIWFLGSTLTHWPADWGSHAWGECSWTLLPAAETNNGTSERVKFVLSLWKETELPREIRKILFKETGLDEWVLWGISSTVKAKMLLLGNVIPLQSIVTTAFGHVTYCHFIQSPCFSTLQAKYF